MRPPVPVRCPAPVPSTAPPGPEATGLEPLLARLADPAPVEAAETFPVGMLRPDGRVDLCKQALGVAGALRVLPLAVRSPHARHLLLGTNSVGDTGAAALADALSAEHPGEVPGAPSPDRAAGGHRLETLYLGCNHISAEGAGRLAGWLAHDTTVRALWLKRNPLGDAGVTAVAAMLRRNTSIRTLDLVNTGLTPHGLRALLEALLDRPVPVERLFLSGNGLGPDAAGLLAALARDAGVRELYLAANHLGDAGARALAAAARADRPLSLGLGGNGVGPAGARALAAALDGVELLDLGRPPSERALGAPPNAIGDDGVAALAAALPGSALRRLELRHAGFTARGAVALVDALLPACADEGPGLHFHPALPAASVRLEYLGLGPGIPRQLKQEVRALLHPAGPAHPDLLAINSVYR
ncbi:gala protein [Nonomuraea sp. SBT364]|uniref:gala protein n=1 Tax=Nonomuraea sp. SBT364 TaxID=1580530 RepID=UPI00066BB67A|nr:gala protein [Nonomuraea sp. SBT364]